MASKPSEASIIEGRQDSASNGSSKGAKSKAGSTPQHGKG